MKVTPIPAGYNTITPYLYVDSAEETLEFMKNAFGAVEAHMTRSHGKIMNAALKIGTSMIMISERTDDRAPWTAMLYLYFEDVDKVFKQAVKAGGKIVMEPTDQFYGDRSGAVSDPSGNQWWIATRKEDVSEEEMKKRMSKMEKK